LFINGVEMSGGVAPLPRLRAALDRALKNTGTAAPQPPANQTSPKN
jgi:hypothetical protein